MAASIAGPDRFGPTPLRMIAVPVKFLGGGYDCEDNK
jgi:hypothetical protein